MATALGYSGAYVDVTVPAGKTSVDLSVESASGGDATEYPSNNIDWLPLSSSAITAGTWTAASWVSAQVGSLCFIAVSSHHTTTLPTVSVSAGWTLVDQVSVYDSTAVRWLKLEVWSRVKQSGDAAPQVTSTGTSSAMVATVIGAAGASLALLGSGARSLGRSSSNTWASAGSGRALVVGFASRYNGTLPLTRTGSDTRFAAYTGNANNLNTMSMAAVAAHGTAGTFGFTRTNSSTEWGLQIDVSIESALLPGAPGGKGGRVEATYPVTPGDVLRCYVGGKGATSQWGTSTSFPGGWPNAGSAVRGAGSGGGMSRVDLISGVTTTLLTVPGGGGGGGNGVGPKTVGGAGANSRLDGFSANGGAGSASAGNAANINGGTTSAGGSGGGGGGSGGGSTVRGGAANAGGATGGGCAGLTSHVSGTVTSSAVKSVTGDGLIIVDFGTQGGWSTTRIPLGAGAWH